MVAEIDMTATCEDGRPVSALADLIARRAQVMGETTRDAATATIITALKSLRAATRKNRGGIKKVSTEIGDKLSVSVQTLSGFTLGFQGGREYHAVVRDSTGAKHPEIKPWIKASQRDGSQIFQVVLSGDRVQAWPHQRRVSYIAADSLTEATSIITERFAKVAAKGSSLAKDALSLAMQRVSSKPASMKSGRQNILADLVSVSKNETGFSSGSVEIEVADNLRYATDALNGGESFVATALARAANSVNGYINSYIDKHGLDDDKGDRPFPESMFDPESGELL